MSPKPNKRFDPTRDYLVSRIYSEVQAGAIAALAVLHEDKDLPCAWYLHVGRFKP